MKNILLYNYDEPLPEQGGIERVTDVLAQELLHSGYNVSILCYKPNRIHKNYEAPVPIYFIPEFSPQKFICELIKKLKIDIVIDQTEGGIVGPFGFLKKRPKAWKDVALLAVQHSSTRSVLKNVKLIFGKTGNTTVSKIKALFYNYTFLKIRHLHFIYHAWQVNRNLDKNYDMTLLLSESFKEDFLHYYPFANQEKLLTIPNPNTYDKSIPSSLDKRVLFVGRVKNNPKGVDKLLRIWKKVERENTSWTLDIVGDGEDRTKLEQMKLDLDLKNVIFHGFQDPLQYYRKASIICMTSLYEGFPMVLNEAMIHGVVPVVFNSFGSAKDIIEDRKSGFLVEPFDEDSFAERLKILMTSTDTLHMMSENARLHSSNFSKEIIGKKWISLIDSL